MTLNTQDKTMPPVAAHLMWQCKISRDGPRGEYHRVVVLLINTKPYAPHPVIGEESERFQVGHYGAADIIAMAWWIMKRHGLAKRLSEDLGIEVTAY